MGKPGRPKGSKDIHPRARHRKITKERINKVLKTLEKTGNLHASCAKHNISRQSFYNMMRANPAFKERVEMARDKASSVLEEEIHNRAVEGEKKDVYYKGEVVGQEVVKSDTLLLRLLEANDPARWGKNSNVKVDQTITHKSDVKQQLAEFLGVKVDDPIPVKYSEKED